LRTKRESVLPAISDQCAAEIATLIGLTPAQLEIVGLSPTQLKILHICFTLAQRGEAVTHHAVGRIIDKSAANVSEQSKRIRKKFAAANVAPTHLPLPDVPRVETTERHLTQEEGWARLRKAQHAKGWARFKKAQEVKRRSKVWLLGFSELYGADTSRGRPGSERQMDARCLARRQYGDFLDDDAGLK
jgi:hypothetical protein